MNKNLKVLARSPYLPPVKHDAEWWMTKESRNSYCPHCREWTPDSPAVMRYHPELDPHGLEMNNPPGWAKLGWVAWFDCQTCGIARQKAVSEAQVIIWGKKLGGWERR